mmetsp:Transcript_17314/g.60499  ORF Transcript_17314/g.60499 Transcript_17314/m.60499 type:complete len:88 (+) Transcript_17314:470-733(+)
MSAGFDLHPASGRREDRARETKLAGSICIRLKYLRDDARLRSFSWRRFHVLSSHVIFSPGSWLMLFRLSGRFPEEPAESSQSWIEFR